MHCVVVCKNEGEDEMQLQQLFEANHSFATMFLLGSMIVDAVLTAFFKNGKFTLKEAMANYGTMGHGTGKMIERFGTEEQKRMFLKVKKKKKCLGGKNSPRPLRY